MAFPSSESLYSSIILAQEALADTTATDMIDCLKQETARSLNTELRDDEEEKLQKGRGIKSYPSHNSSKGFHRGKWSADQVHPG